MNNSEIGEGQKLYDYISILTEDAVKVAPLLLEYLKNAEIMTEGEKMTEYDVVENIFRVFYSWDLLKNILRWVIKI